MTMKYKFKIQGLDCANCASQLEKSINKIDDIVEATINFMSERLTIECDEDKKEDVIQNVKKVIKKEEPDVVINEL